MFNFIKDFCEKGENTGLLLVDMPTGSGKTHAVLEYICQEYDKPQNKNKMFFFITNLKKNLPTEELYEKFVKKGKKNAFDADFLQIDSNEDCVLEKLTEDLEEIIPQSIQRAPEYFSLKSQRDLLRNIKGQLAKESLSKEFRERTEPKFRKMIQGMLKKQFKTAKERLRAIEIDDKWKWVGKLYPAIFTSRKRILFMSVNKFFTKNTTIIEPSYEFINNKILDNAIVFIDEFDASKETLLDQIITEGLNNRINFLELFKVIHSAFQINEFQNDLTTPSMIWQQYYSKGISLKKQFKDMSEKSTEIFKKYKLQFSHRTESSAEENGKNFLFQDYRYLSILDNNKKFVATFPDKSTRLNKIRFTEDVPKKEQTIQPLLHDIKQFLSRFQKFVDRLATNYRQLKKERDATSEITQEEAIRSVLDLFHLREDQHNYLLSRVMDNTSNQNKNFDKVEIDTTIHTKGFRYYAFEDEQSHDMQSVIKLCEFSATPEKYILQISKKAKVIGVSATATLPSVIGNYDLSFFRSQLGEDFHYLSKETKQHIKDECYANWSKYNEVNIHAELLDELGVFNNSEFESYASNSIAQTQCSDFDATRYLRICSAYKNFILHDDIKSFLCILTKHPKVKDEHLNLDLLYQLFEYVAEDNNFDFSKDAIVLLTGHNYDDTKKSITERLRNCKKLFVISAYQTIGAGQNLQYGFDESQKDSLINVDKYRTKLEKDFDAIYLDKPTHMLVNLIGGLKDSDFAKSIFQTEFMQEKGEISRNEAAENIKKAFRCIMGGKKDKDSAEEDYSKLYDKKSVKLFATRLIIQAVGRICRTGWKSKDIYIFADKAIGDAIDTSVINGGFYNKEFVALVDRIKKDTEFQEENIKDYSEDTLRNAAVTRSYKTFRDIEFMLESNWSKHTMDKWKKIRDFVIKSPTLSVVEAEKSDVGANYYIRVPILANKLYFKEKSDFQDLEISFTPAKGFRELSESKAKLDSIMKYEPLAKFFDDQGYAREFKPNEYLMSPPLWSNIYKGMLGEVAGEYLFKKLVGYELNEIDQADIFEKFDFQIVDKPIYVDFKNWNESFDLNQKETRTKILKKAKEVDAKLVIVANILAEDKYKIDCRNEDGIVLLVIPSILTKTDDIVIENIQAITKIKEVINECTV